MHMAEHRASKGSRNPEGTMMTRDPKASWAGLLALCLLFVQGCGTDKISVPGINGPSELAVSLKLTVNPDIITADGFSTALVQAEVRGTNGQALANVDVYFTLADESGNFADIGTLSANRAITNSQGIAQVIYTAPPRTDATANQTLLILARPVANDAQAAVYRTVRLELRSAEPHLFPQTPGTPGTCDFIIETPDGFYAGVDILFQDTSQGTIVRYYWDFGDGTRDDKPDENHRYAVAGTYTVTHVCTDADGGQTLRQRTFTLN